MITINLNEEYTLEYIVNEVEKIEKVSLVITFPNSVVYRFVASVDIPNSKVIVHLPALEKMIRREIDATEYLEVGNTDRYYKVNVEGLSFKYVVEETPDIVIDIPDSGVPIEVNYINENIITLPPETVVLKKRKIQ